MAAALAAHCHVVLACRLSAGHLRFEPIFGQFGPSRHGSFGGAEAVTVSTAREYVQFCRNLGSFQRLKQQQAAVRRNGIISGVNE